jgi:hypothetical protein
VVRTITADKRRAKRRRRISASPRGANSRAVQLPAIPKKVRACLREHLVIKKHMAAFLAIISNCRLARTWQAVNSPPKILGVDAGQNCRTFSQRRSPDMLK